MSKLQTGVHAFGANGVEIKFRQLEIFYAVAIAGTMTRASQRVGLSQPSISQQLAKLEDQLGAQLIERNRSGKVALTPAGEFWFRHADDMIRLMQESLKEHEQRFRNGAVVLRLGITPALRGTFVMAAAKIAIRENDFAKFEVVYDLNSNALFEQLRMHKINVAILAAEVLGPEAGTFAIGDLYTDHIALAVPICVSEDELAYALSPGADARKVRPELLRYVEIDSAVPDARALGRVVPDAPAGGDGELRRAQLQRRGVLRGRGAGDGAPADLDGLVPPAVDPQPPAALHDQRHVAPDRAGDAQAPAHARRLRADLPRHRRLLPDGVLAAHGRARGAAHRAAARDSLPRSGRRGVSRVRPGPGDTAIGDGAARIHRNGSAERTATSP